MKAALNNFFYFFKNTIYFSCFHVYFFTISPIDDAEFDTLTDEQKSEYTTKIKPSIFENIEIDLNDIFDF